jgi:CRISPR/Cas system-associated protein Csm6
MALSPKLATGHVSRTLVHRRGHRCCAVLNSLGRSASRLDHDAQF